MDEDTGRPADRQWNDDTIVGLPDHALVLEIDDEAVVLDTNSETYFQVNAVGAFVLGRIADSATFADLVTAVVGEYEVDRDTAGDDLDELLESLASRNLITTA